MTTMSSVLASQMKPTQRSLTACIVLRERRQQGEDLVADRDEEDVEAGERKEVSVAEHGPVSQLGSRLVVVFLELAARPETPASTSTKTKNVTASGRNRRVKLAGSDVVAMRPPDEAAETDAEVHADPLEGEGGVAVLCGRQARVEPAHVGRQRAHRGF
jgi:hypothetical protein